MALLRRGQTDVNTEDAELIDAALADVTELNDLVAVKLGAEAYTVLPEKRTWVHQAWSGDVVNAQYYLPEGETIDNIGYWYPADGGGMIGSDAIAVMRGAERPVLAHTFLNYLLDKTHAIENYGWLGYQPPQNDFDPDSVVADGYVPDASRLGDHPSAGLRPRLPVAAAESRRREDLGRRLVEVHRRCLIDLASTRRLWPAFAAPGVVWLILLFLVPFYAILAVAFGDLDPIFGNAVPVWNPLEWDFTLFDEILGRVFGGELGRVFVRTFLYVGLALTICFLIGYPVAYYVSRKAGPSPRPAARPAPGAVLDQLPDADAGVGQPAPGRRLRQRCSRRCSGSTARTGSTGVRSP